MLADRVRRKLLNITVSGSVGPGPQTLAAGTMEHGYFGITSTEDLIDSFGIATECGVTHGIQFNIDGWLKFAFNNKILFVAKKPVRYGLSWNNLYAAGCIWGDGTEGGNKIAIINNLSYKVRLLRGLNDNYDPKTTAPGSDGVHCHNSEWNKLLIPIHTNLKSNGTWGGEYSVNVETSLPYWEINFSDVDFQTAPRLEGSHSWTQNSSDKEADKICRGGNGCAYSGYDSINGSIHAYSWRPVLELV